MEDDCRRRDAETVETFTKPLLLLSHYSSAVVFLRKHQRFHRGTIFFFTATDRNFTAQLGKSSKLAVLNTVSVSNCTSPAIYSTDGLVSNARTSAMFQLHHTIFPQNDILPLLSSPHLSNFGHHSKTN